MMPLDEFIKYAVTVGGVSALVGAILAIVAEFWPAFQDLERRWKLVVIMALSFVIPLAATGLGLYRGIVTGTLEAVFMALQAGALSFFATQIAHIPDMGK